MKTGKWTFFNGAGRIEEEATDDDEKDFFIRYYPDGQRALMGEFADRERDAVWHYTAAHGETTVNETYKRGALIKRIDWPRERLPYSHANGRPG